VWGPAYAEESQYTRVYVGQLRKKLEDDPSNPSLIVTESGIGYRFAG
jgi:two-component system KDP operon response regulator KdpE